MIIILSTSLISLHYSYKVIRNKKYNVEQSPSLSMGDVFLPWPTEIHKSKFEDIKEKTLNLSM